MSEQESSKEQKPEEVKKDDKNRDSFGQPIERSPWGVFAMLQIPLVLLMVILLYVMYQASKGN